MKDKIYFLHHHDRPNIGDILSGPYRYFDFGNYHKLSWDSDMLSYTNSMEKNSTLVMGGGIYFTKNKKIFRKVVEHSKNFIGWGLGLDPRDNLQYIDKFDLLGTRERQISIINNKNIFYVPCASCMKKEFSINNNPNETREFHMHINGGFNTKSILSAIKQLGLEVSQTSTLDNFQTIFSSLSSANIIITNSYHGAYWASLLRKKVIVIKTVVPKFDGLDSSITYSDLTENSLTQAIRKAKKVPSYYLLECQSINKDFFQKVNSIYNK
jgi:exopolysaccharide biosynthesis predicted pyruvyltransferase EpsI